MSKLPKRQQQLHDLLLGRGDVLIVDLYAAMFETNPMKRGTRTVAEKQRHLGPYITTLNRSLDVLGRKLRVEPGALKNTYRLVAVSQ